MGHPTVEVTLLFTDIEGSTALAHELGDAYVDLLAQHNRIVRDAIGQYTGVEARNEGDAFFAVFDRADDAVGAALAIQRALSAHVWLHGRPVRVRMGIHSGPAIRLLHDFAGLNVHLASRVSAAGHGGQVVASQAVLDALGGDAPFDWIELGAHLVKDFPEPIVLFQLRADGLAETFPPLNTIDARDHNLPAMVTSFVGREAELADLRTLLTGHARLITLTGPGGVGKTRIATEAAWSVLSRFRAGAWFVDFAPVTDHAAILDTIIAAAGTRDLAHLVATFAAGPALLVLDNLEQLISGVVVIADLLKQCPTLVVLATTRERLRLQGEHEVILDGLTGDEAIDLFAARAALVRRDFEVDARVGQLCERVGGLPLAIELAAARLRAESIDSLLAAMDDMLATLTEGERDRPARHQGMHAAIAVSADALTEAERAVFRAFAVFAGGATIDAVGVICAPKADEIESLVDKSLLRRTGDRLTMLEPIRQFAEQRLRADVPGEYEQRVQQHAQFFLEVAGRLEPQLVTARQRDALEQLSAEHANLLLAIDRGDGDIPLRIAAGLARFWVTRGHTHEGRSVFARVLAEHPAGDPHVRAAALLGAGNLAMLQNDLAAARRDLAEVSELGTPSQRGHASNLFGGAALQEGDLAAAEAHFREARTSDDALVVVAARNGEGYVAAARGEFEAAAEAFREAYVASEHNGEVQGALRAVGNLGVALLNQGLIAEATEAFERSLELARATGNRGSEAAAFQNLARAGQATGDLARGSENHARVDTYLRSAIAIFEELGYRRELAHALMFLTAVAAKDEGLAALRRAEGLFRDAGDEAGLSSVAQMREAFLEECD